jgi:hypothetical protein
MDGNQNHIWSEALKEWCWTFLQAKNWFLDDKCSLLRVISATISHFTSVGERRQIHLITASVLCDSSYQGMNMDH